MERGSVEFRAVVWGNWRPVRLSVASRTSARRQATTSASGAQSHSLTRRADQRQRYATITSASFQARLSLGIACYSGGTDNSNPAPFSREPAFKLASEARDGARSRSAITPQRHSVNGRWRTHGRARRWGATECKSCGPCWTQFAC
jgi:hypothetical protein